eukprot:Lithocolla_globosa_v1_NODE_684_length_3444_cov_23.143755.p6 type:complete len:104 gc:universal NODE_684_length_3444_cov_23.143755:2264-1953(-)
MSVHWSWRESRPRFLSVGRCSFGLTEREPSLPPFLGYVAPKFVLYRRQTAQHSGYLMQCANPGYFSRGRLTKSVTFRCLLATETGIFSAVTGALRLNILSIPG